MGLYLRNVTEKCLIKDSVSYEKDLDIDMYNKLVKKYLIEDFTSESDVYQALIDYRIDCINSGIDEYKCIVKYLNNYEIRNIVKLIETEKQTKDFSKWFNLVFGHKINKNEEHLPIYVIIISLLTCGTLLSLLGGLIFTLCKTIFGA